MTGFDKLSAALAALLGGVFIVFGIMGIILPVRFWVSLPPVVSTVWFFVGWGIVRSVYLAWNLKPNRKKTRKKISPEISSPPSFAAEPESDPDFSSTQSEFELNENSEEDYSEH